MSAFDLDAYRDAHQPWEFVAGGHHFVARLVSAEDVRRFNAGLAGADARGQLRALATLLRRAFPWRFSYRWRGDPVQLILGLEPAAQREAMVSFFEWVGQTQGNALPPTRTTAGTPSPAPTPAPTS